MKHIARLLPLVLLALLLVSCGTSTSVGTLVPYESHRYSQMADLVPCGETTIEVEYSSYLGGLLHNIHTVNGTEYDALNRKHVHKCRGLGGMLEKAAYKVVEQYPDARFFQVVRTEKTSEKLFLGSTVKRKAIIRAYRFK